MKKKTPSKGGLQCNGEKIKSCCRTDTAPLHESKTMKFILYLIIAVLISSCGVNYNLRRMAYHKRMAIAKGAEFTRDTVFTDRVVITPGDSTTVFVPVKELRDSLVTVYQDRIKIQYRLKRDTIRVNVECPSDTITVSVPVSVTETLCPPINHTWRTVSFILLGLLIMLGLILSRRH